MTLPLMPDSEPAAVAATLRDELKALVALVGNNLRKLTHGLLNSCTGDE